MRLRLVLLALLVAVAACDSSDPVRFNPDAVDFDAVTDLSYRTYVAPLLDARGVFPGAPSGFAAFFASDAGAFIVPFDADGSALLRLAEAPARVETGAEIDVSRLEPDEVRYLRRWVEAGAPNDDGVIPYEDVRLVAYVCNQLGARVSVVGVQERRVIRTLYFAELDLDGVEPGADVRPHDVVAEPDGSAWYVSLIDGNTVLKLSADLNAIGRGEALLGQTPAGAFEKPGMLALDPDGALYAGRSFSLLSGGASIAQVDRGTMALDEIAVPFGRPHAIGRVGRVVLSASLAENAIASLDVADAGAPALADLLRLDGGTKALVMFDVRPDGQEAVLTSQLSEEVFFLDVSDPADLVVSAVVPVGEQPWHPTYGVGGDVVYVPNRVSNTVSVVDAVAKNVLATIEHPAFAEPHGSAVTPDGRTLLVTSRNTTGAYAPTYAYLDADGELLPASATGTVVVIDTESLAVEAVIELGPFPSGVEVAVR